MLQMNYQHKGVPIGQISLHRSLWPARLNIKPSIVDITSNNEFTPNAVAEYITTIYQTSYDASIRVYYPTLLSINNEMGDILAAVGMRVADTEPLFLEQYLDKPIEDVIGACRSKIVEIGNLASNCGGASLYLSACRYRPFLAPSKLLIPFNLLA